MMNVLFNRLSEMGFVPKRDYMLWGKGAYFSWGRTITVKHVGKGYSVAYHSWGHDQEMDLVFEEKSEYWFRRHSDIISLIEELKERK